MPKNDSVKRTIRQKAAFQLTRESKVIWRKQEEDCLRSTVYVILNISMTLLTLCDPQIRVEAIGLVVDPDHASVVKRTADLDIFRRGDAQKSLTHC